MTQEQKVIKAKIGLLELAKQLGSVSQACKVMGYSRGHYKTTSCVWPMLRAIPGTMDARNPAAPKVSLPAGVSVVLRIRFRVVLRVLRPRIRFRVVLCVLLPCIRLCIVFLIPPGLRLAVSPGVTRMCGVGMSTSTQKVADST